MFEDKSILITGGTGSFGQNCIKMLLDHHRAKRIIVYSRDEYKQYLLKQQFSHHPNAALLRFFIGDVRDLNRLERAFNKVDIVIHAAAMKQVPTCEYNPFEAIKTNINGAQNVIDAALNQKVKKVVALSTDKAVNPINLYGGTKLVSDKLFVSANAYAGGDGTIFSVVRYGNVAGSRGSIIPVFRKLADEGCNTFPITDLRMTRFWITLEQGVELVFKALREAKGGETYISKIPSFRIADLAKAFNPNCNIDEIGIREGEKLHEVMITRDDSRMTYAYDHHYIIYPHFEWWNKERGFTDGGKPVESGFEYSSETNSQWLSVESMKRFIEMTR